MRTEEGGFVGEGGVGIFHRSWWPDTEPRATVVICHGMSEHSGRYEQVASALVDAGFAVRALDHRGHGRSEGPRSLIDSVPNAVADIGRLVDLAGERPFLLGHSMGGCLALAYALDHQDRLAGLVLSSPLAVLDAASPPVRAISRALSATVPRLGVLKIDASAISRDPAEVAMYERDPLNFRGRLPVRSIAGLAETIDTFPGRLPSLTLPLLVIHGTGDQLVPSAGGKLVADLAGSGDVTLKLYDGAYHELFHELEDVRALATADVVGWLRKRAA